MKCLKHLSQHGTLSQNRVPQNLMVDPCWSSFPPWKLKPPMRLHIGQWGKQAKRKDSWGSLTFRTFKTSLKSGRSPVFFWGGGYWVKIGRNWGIKGPALGWTTFDPDFSFRIKPLDSNPTRSLVFLCPNLADLRPNRSKPEKCSNDNDLLLASFLGTWAGWHFFFSSKTFCSGGHVWPRCCLDVRGPPQLSWSNMVKLYSFMFTYDIRKTYS